MHRIDPSSRVFVLDTGRLPQAVYDLIDRVRDRYGKATQMWVQGFRVAQGMEPLLGQEMRLMAACGMRDIAMWSYLATAYMSSHACARPEQVWQVFTRTMAELSAEEA